MYYETTPPPNAPHHTPPGSARNESDLGCLELHIQTLLCTPFPACRRRRRPKRLSSGALTLGTRLAVKPSSSPRSPTMTCLPGWERRTMATWRPSSPHGMAVIQASRVSTSDHPRCDVRKTRSSTIVFFCLGSCRISCLQENFIKT